MGRFGKDYEVGRGKPPISGQFKKGKSGNPAGRPKGVKNFTTDVEEILATKVRVQENGKSIKVSSQRATLMRLREQALNGDPRAMDRILTLAQQMGAEKEAASSERALSDAEEDILAQFTQSFNAPSGSTETGCEDQSTDSEQDGGGDDG